MEIKELKVRQGNVEVIASVIEKSEPRTFDKQGNTGRVCKAIIKDDSGSITLTLWNDEIDKISIGDKIKITNGYVGEWQGELQLSAGKFGKIDIVEKGQPKVYTNIPPVNLNEEDDYASPEEVYENLDDE